MIASTNNITHENRSQISTLAELQEHQWWELTQMVVERTLSNISTEQETLDYESLKSFVPYQELQTEVNALISTFTPKQKKKHTARQRTSIETKGLTAINDRSDIVAHELKRGLIDLEYFEQNENKKLARYAHTFNVPTPKGQEKKDGKITISLQAGDSDSWDTILSALQTLGDECVDTYTAIMAICIEKNGTRNMSTAFEVSPDDILEICQKSKRNGSYTPEQRARVIKHLKTLSMAYVSITVPSYKKVNRRGMPIYEPTTIIGKGSVVDLLSGSITEYSDITGKELETRVFVCIGPWVDMKVRTETARLPRKVLEYNSQKQRYQKRIGRYLSRMFRINTYRYDGNFLVSMDALFKGSDITCPRQRGEFKDAIDTALAQLKKDNVIGDYKQEQLPKEIEQQITERARGWFDLYLESKINFTPPKEAVEHYKNILQIEQGDCAGVDEGA